MPYKTPSSWSSFGKAIARASRGLPQSPHKKAFVIHKLAASDGIDIQNTQTKFTSLNKNKLSHETREPVIEFYARDDISRMMPGKADYITVKNPDGTKENKQKRHLIMTVREACRAFKDNYPEIKVGKSKFAELRPKHTLTVNNHPPMFVFTDATAMASWSWRLFTGN